jgi:hypothetical protein
MVKTTGADRKRFQSALASLVVLHANGESLVIFCLARA